VTSATCARCTPSSCRQQRGGPSTVRGRREGQTHHSGCRVGFNPGDPDGPLPRVLGGGVPSIRRLGTAPKGGHPPPYSIRWEPPVDDRRTHGDLRGPWRAGRFVTGDALVEAVGGYGQVIGSL
jgi:hypothetical protein